MAKSKEDTPMLKQYFSIKAQHPEAVLLYRVGDFYEAYSDDALLVSKVLGLVLTGDIFNMFIMVEILTSAAVAVHREEYRHRGDVSLGRDIVENLYRAVAERLVIVVHK